MFVYVLRLYLIKEFERDLDVIMLMERLVFGILGKIKFFMWSFNLISVLEFLECFVVMDFWGRYRFFECLILDIFNKCW